MQEALEFHTLDVFTDEPYSGNPLAVVLGADALTDAQMQAIAREFNLSETVFVMAPARPEHTARLRIFLPRAEIPFAGHPTIGAAVLLSGLLDGAGEAHRQLVLELEAGLVPVRVSRQAGRVRAELTAPVLPHAVPVPAPSAAAVAPALGLGEGDMGCGPHLAPALWQGGPRFLFVPLRDTAALGRARPSEPRWSSIMAQAGTDSAWLYTRVGAGAYRARMFSPGSGVAEDPGTGSACAILAVELQAAGLLENGITRLTVTQGVEMGRPSQIAVSIKCDDGALRSVRIAGGAAPVSEGRIMQP
ncbi:PhzF family phenazine biosynthesis protein [Alkalilacustris brevis]|uniref:PhzF family phenazine biosynthesis protein n=1 Tax=Alkalilacustris brevis TaxID=2026338 RepID=UPI000E0D682B|nr:PhzF family phenazine biosynthesis protein [Alkalilacustris brevis]